MKHTTESLYKALKDIGVKENTKMFLGKPDRWYDDPHWRCINNHVSIIYIKSEIHGGLCPVCMKNVFLTFPEDVDGEPLKK